MWQPRRGWVPAFVDLVLAATIIGFCLFVAVAFVGLNGCTVVNVAAGDNTKVDEGGKGVVVIRPTRE